MIRNSLSAPRRPAVARPEARVVPGKRYFSRPAPSAPPPRLDLAPLADGLTGATAAVDVALARRLLDLAKERELEAGQAAAFRAGTRKLVAAFERWAERSAALDSRFRRLDAELCRLDADDTRARIDALGARLATAKRNFDAPTVRALEAEQSYVARWHYYFLQGRPEDFAPKRATALRWVAMFDYLTGQTIMRYAPAAG